MPGFITLADAKAHLVVLDENDDGLIQDLVDAASKHAEARTGYVAEIREETFLFDRFKRHLELRLRPVDATASRCSTSTATATCSLSRTSA
jgi:hypothetical protein